MLKIGVMDSGVGGLTILKAIHDCLPAADLLYFADQKYSPYGDLTPEQICQRLFSIGHYFEQQCCDVVVVACNTATVIGITALRARLNIPVVGVEPAVKPACNGLQAARVSVLATPVTANSVRLNALINEWRGESEVEVLSSAVLAQMIDCMPKTELMLINEVERICMQVLLHQSSALVLACTHYPLIRHYFESALLPNGLEIVEPSRGVAAQVERVLCHHAKPTKTRAGVMVVQSNGVLLEHIEAMRFWLSRMGIHSDVSYCDY